jgi:hypothetical protein
MVVKKPVVSGVKGTGKLAADDPAAFKGFPGWRNFFLSQTYEEDSAERQPGLLIVCARNDLWQFTLKEPSSCLMLKLAARTWDEMILLGEAALVDAGAPWESDPYEAAKRGRSRGRRS